MQAPSRHATLTAQRPRSHLSGRSPLNLRHGSQNVARGTSGSRSGAAPSTAPASGSGACVEAPPRAPHPAPDHLPHPRPHHVTRRALLRRAAASVLAATAGSGLARPTAAGALTIGSDDPTTLLNSVLAGYGLPKLPGSTGFKLLDDFELDFTLEYPRGWVVRPNTLRKGVYISDFNTADKATVEVLPLPPPLPSAGAGGDAAAGAAAGGLAALAAAAVAAAVSPGGGASASGDDKLMLPSARSVKSRTEIVDGKEYLYLEFPSETVTRSGYQVRRRNFAVAAVRRDSLITLNASARSDQYNEEKAALLRHVVESFRVR